MNIPEEKLLLDTMLSGDPASFQPFIEQYKRLVGHIVARMVRRTADREDLCQDIFIKIYQNINKFQFKSKVSTWVATIAYNTCVNYLEKKRIPLLRDLNDAADEGDPFEQVGDDQEPPDQRVEQQDLARQLQQAMNAMAPVYTTILTLFHVEEMKYQEIADIMELPVGTVKSYLFRARQMLRGRLLQSRVEECL
jgi:RNA polymerase sigma-70 factor (ECF subfamily)